MFNFLKNRAEPLPPIASEDGAGLWRFYDLPQEIESIEGRGLRRVIENLEMVIFEGFITAASWPAQHVTLSQFVPLDLFITQKFDARARVKFDYSQHQKKRDASIVHVHGGVGEMRHIHVVARPADLHQLANLSKTGRRVRITGRRIAIEQSIEETPPEIVEQLEIEWGKVKENGGWAGAFFGISQFLEWINPDAKKKYDFEYPPAKQCPVIKFENLEILT